jgi:hypothetical protein
MRTVLWLVMASGVVSAQGWKPMFDGKTLDGWEVIGDGFWQITSDGTLLGARRPARAGAPAGMSYAGWRDNQSWLYTTRNDYAEFDLHLQYWTRPMGNSGISIRDSSRGKCGVAMPPDFKCTPSKIGYEIQINNQYPDPHPTGSIYTFVDAKTGAQKDNEWNTLDIESRKNMIRVKLNGAVVAEHAGDPQRPKTGPIGLQLHDQFSVVMFRDVRIRELQ